MKTNFQCECGIHRGIYQRGIRCPFCCTEVNILLPMWRKIYYFFKYKKVTLNGRTFIARRF